MKKTLMIGLMMVSLFGASAQADLGQSPRSCDLQIKYADTVVKEVQFQILTTCSVQFPGNCAHNFSVNGNTENVLTVDGTYAVKDKQTGATTNYTATAFLSESSITAPYNAPDYIGENYEVSIVSDEPPVRIADSGTVISPDSPRVILGVREGSSLTQLAAEIICK